MLNFTDINNPNASGGPINPMGSCFASTSNDILKNPSLPTNAYVCHGVVICDVEGATERGMEIPHAWIEFEDNGILKAIDTTFGTIQDAENYREIKKAKIWHKYNKLQFLALLKKHGGRVPFDAKLLQLCRKMKEVTKRPYIRESWDIRGN